MQHEVGAGPAAQLARREIAEGDRLRPLADVAVGDARGVALSLLFFLGPVYVLMPYVVKNSLHGGAEGLGLVFAAGGVGADRGSAAARAARRCRAGRSRSSTSRGREPRSRSSATRSWSAVWQAMLVSFFSVGCLTTGGIVWTTVLQRAVPGKMIGRVSSLDWVLSLGLDAAVVRADRPGADLLGARATLLRRRRRQRAVLLLVFACVPAVRAVDASVAPAQIRLRTACVRSA